jgi:hypothetical protein
VQRERRDHSGASPSDFRGDVTLIRRTAARRQQQACGREKLRRVMAGAERRREVKIVSGCMDGLSAVDFSVFCLLSVCFVGFWRQHPRGFRSATRGGPLSYATAHFPRQQHLAKRAMRVVVVRVAGRERGVGLQSRVK